MKPGSIVEGYTGLFAKVVQVTEGGHTHLSAWVRTPELAQEETVGVIALNDFGLSQVLKDGENAPGAAEAVEAKAEKKAKAKKEAE